MRTSSAILALCLVYPLACSSGKSSPPDAHGLSSASSTQGEPGRLRIASYNVLYSLAEKRAGVNPARWADPDTVRLIQGIDADVLLFQETNEAWESALRAALSGRFPHCVFHRPKRFLPEGLGACARHPLDGDATLTSPVGWFPARQIRLHAPSGVVEIINVHLQPAVASPAEWWQTHRATRPPRKREIEAYLAGLSKGAPAIIVGDFNEITEGDLFKTLDAAGFDSALAGAGEKAVTWSWPGLDPPLGAQIDHVTYRRSAFTLVSAKVLSGGNSDHVPIVVELAARRD